MHRKSLAVPLVVLGVATAAHAQEADVKLSTTAGAYVRLADVFRGKPVVLFYEDKDSTSLNQPLKDALFAAGKEKGLLGAASVVAIANVQPYDWFPARGFVVSAVKQTEKAIGVPVYLDWTGAMARPPWSLAPNSSTVVVLDRTGAVKYHRKGRHSAEEIGQVLSLLGLLIGTPR